MAIRSFDGSDNNTHHADWGRAGTALLRLTVPHAYENGVSDTRSGPNARTVSNLVCREEVPRLSAFGLSDFVWAWGQYLDHEMDMTPDGNNGDLEVTVGQNDPYFPPGALMIPRSTFHPASGTGPDNPAEQTNNLSSFIDAANVYGPSQTHADSLRAGSEGKLKVSPGDLLPTTQDEDGNTVFLAGDARANENSVLISLHTLSVREHNRRCDDIVAAQPGLSDEEIFQRARRYVGALHQVITYKEFLPALLGSLAPGVDSEYDPDLDPGISNIFATVGYRLGHSMLSETIRIASLGDQPGVRDAPRHLALADAFFANGIPHVMDDAIGIEGFLAGLVQRRMREVDTTLVESVRSFLFKRSKLPPFLHDLAASNIVRGRDHGLPDYVTCREAMRRQISKGHIPFAIKRHFKFQPVRVFTDISQHASVTRRLDAAYDTVEDIDPWVGMLAEDHVGGARVGELCAAILVDQFVRCRDGDRFWYRRDADLVGELAETDDTLADLENRRLSDVIRDNSRGRIPFLQGNVFFAPH
jgi:peroxidase